MANNTPDNLIFHDRLNKEDQKAKQEELKQFREEALDAEAQRDKSFKAFMNHYAETGRLTRRQERQEQKAEEKKLKKGAKGLSGETVLEKSLSGLKDGIKTIGSGIAGGAAASAMSTPAGRLLMGVGGAVKGIGTAGKYLGQRAAKMVGPKEDDISKEDNTSNLVEETLDSNHGDLTQFFDGNKEELEEQTETLERIETLLEPDPRKAQLEAERLREQRRMNKLLSAGAQNKKSSVSRISSTKDEDEDEGGLFDDLATKVLAVKGGLAGLGTLLAAGGPVLGGLAAVGAAGYGLYKLWDTYNAGNDKDFAVDTDEEKKLDAEWRKKYDIGYTEMTATIGSIVQDLPEVENRMEKANLEFENDWMETLTGLRSGQFTVEEVEGEKIEVTQTKANTILIEEMESLIPKLLSGEMGEEGLGEEQSDILQWVNEVTGGKTVGIEDQVKGLESLIEQMKTNNTDLAKSLSPKEYASAVNLVTEKGFKEYSKDQLEDMADAAENKHEWVDIGIGDGLIEDKKRLEADATSADIQALLETESWSDDDRLYLIDLFNKKSKPVIPEVTPVPEPVSESVSEPEVAPVPTIEDTNIQEQVDANEALVEALWANHAIAVDQQALDAQANGLRAEYINTLNNSLASGELDGVDFVDKLTDINAMSTDELLAKFDVTPVPKPVLESVPEPVLEPVPESGTGPVLESVPEPVLEPVPESVPKLVLESGTGPVLESVPEPISESGTGPVLESVPEPISVDNLTEQAIKAQSAKQKLIDFEAANPRNSKTIESVIEEDWFGATYDIEQYKDATLEKEYQAIQRELKKEENKYNDIKKETMLEETGRAFSGAGVAMDADQHEEFLSITNADDGLSQRAIDFANEVEAFNINKDVGNMPPAQVSVGQIGSFTLEDTGLPTGASRETEKAYEAAYPIDESTLERIETPPVDTATTAAEAMAESWEPGKSIGVNVHNIDEIDYGFVTKRLNKGAVLNNISAPSSEMSDIAEIMKGLVTTIQQNGGGNNINAPRNTTNTNITNVGMNVQPMDPVSPVYAE